MTFEKEVSGIIKQHGNIGYGDIINLKIIHCLDKEKIKKAIIKYCPGMELVHASNCACVGCKLIRELNL